MASVNPCHISNTQHDRAFLAAALCQAGEGDASALATVYQATSAKLFGICLRILGNRSEAEDALQETFINVWLNAAVFDPARSSPIAWLAALARNKAIDRLRARGLRPSEPLGGEALQVADPAVSASAALEASEEHRMVAGCMAELEDRAAAAIRSAFFGGATYAELAVREGVPLSTMKSRVRRGLIRLKSAASSRGYGPDHERGGIGGLSVRRTVACARIAASTRGH